MVQMKNTNKNLCWQERGMLARTHVHCWWECKLVQPRERCPRVDRAHAQDPTIPVLRRCPVEMPSHGQQMIHTYQDKAPFLITPN